MNAPLWSDGASKRRWMALPAGGKITVAADGDFQFPGGSTLVKEFSVGNTRIETRLFVRHADGDWAGYSYAWNPEQTDATLVGLTSAPLAKTVGGATWHHPSRCHCMACHTPEAGFTLGLEVAQLNRTFTYPDGARNQLTHLQQAGLLAAPLPGAPESLPALPAPDGGGAIGPRARAYLHANCSSCHRPNRRFPDGIDLRFTTSLQRHQDLQPGIGLRRLRRRRQPPGPRPARGLGAHPLHADHRRVPHAPGRHHPGRPGRRGRGRGVDQVAVGVSLSG